VKKFLDWIQSALLILFIIFLFVVMPVGYIIMAICGLIKNPRGFVELIVIAMICGAIFLVYKCYKLYIGKKVQDRSIWWLLSGSREVLEEMRTTCALYPIYIEKQYLISCDSEMQIAREIIEVFQEQSKYLCYRLEGTYKNAKTPYCYFFMRCLSSFLDDKNNIYFNDNKMYVEKSRERREDAGSYYDVKHSITEYGMAYNKLRYMAHFYVDKIDSVKYDHYHGYSEYVKEILDTQEITFFEDIK
jgi:hypothetical protein